MLNKTSNDKNKYKKIDKNKDKEKEKDIQS